MVRLFRGATHFPILILLGGFLAPPTQAAPASHASPEELALRAFDQMGAPGWLLEALAEPSDGERGFPYLAPAGDLDGDGAGDLLSLTRTPIPDWSLVVSGRRGSNGTQLFRTETGINGATVLLEPRPLGGGDPGVLLGAYDFAFIALGSGIGPGPYGERPFSMADIGVQVGLHLAAVRADGTIAWQRSFTDGLFVYTGTTLALVRDLPILVGSLDGAPGPATDLAVAIYDRAPRDAEDQDDTVRALTISGADGTDAGTFEMDIDSTAAAVRAAPDLSGDGLEDLTVALVPGPGETPVSASTLIARRATGGGELWRSTAYPLDLATTVQPVGDANEDGRVDLAVGEPNVRELGTPGRRVVLLDGASGAVLLEAAADTARPAGDLDEDGGAEILLATAHHGSGTARVGFRAVNAAGATLYSGVVSLSGDSDPEGTVLTAGDADGDGFSDPAFRLTVRAGGENPTWITKIHVVSGRTGERIRITDSLGDVLGSSLDGSGDDLVHVSRFGHSALDVTGADGRTGDALFSTRIRPRADATYGWDVRALEVTGDRRPDLLVNTYGEIHPATETYVVTPTTYVYDAFLIDGSSGRLIWSTDPPRLPPAPHVTGSVSTGSPFSWNGTASTGVHGTIFEPTGPEGCSRDDLRRRCERVLLRFTNPPSGDATESTRMATLIIDRFGPVPEPATDIDVYLYESDELGTVGALVDQGAAGGSVQPVGERLTFPVTTTSAQPSRFYLASIVYYRSVESGYRGAVSLA